MPISYLYNEKNNILSISNRLLTFNNIKLILKNLPYVVQDNIDINTLTKPSDTLLDHQKVLLNIDHVNINISLDIINQNDNIYYDNFMLYFYDQNINLNFKNYPMYNVLEKYKYLIYQSINPIKLNQFSFNKDLLTQIPKKTNELLEIRKFNTNTDLAIIDIFLKDIENAPESQNDLYNYIYFLRKFPMFKIILNDYLCKNEQELYSIIANNNLETDYFNELFLSILFDFSDTQKLINNVNNLFKQDYYLNDFFYIIKPINIDIENLIMVYDTIYFPNYGFVNTDFVNINTLTNSFFNLNHSYNIYIPISLYLKINNVDINILKLCSAENFNILISTFLVNLYVIYDYLNLNKYSIEEMIRIYKNNYNNMYNDDNMLIELLFYIHTAYYIFKNNEENILNIIDSNISLLKHFFYIIKYSKNTLPNIFPLIIFLSCSNHNIKFIYEYKNNYILDFLNEYYDIIFKESEKIIIKNSN